MNTVDHTNGFLTNEEQIVLSQLEELQKDLEAIKRLRAKYAASLAVVNGTTTSVATSQENVGQLPAETGTETVVADEYSPSLTWEQRIILILKMIGAAYVDEVVAKIVELQPEVSMKTAGNVATNKLSKLYRNKKIKADTSGKKYKYYL